MKEELITFETAKLAKEKYFDWETEEFYTNPKKPYLTKGIEYMSDCYVRLWKWNSMPSNYPTKAEDVLCAAPTQSLLQKWLREVHNIYVTALPYRDSEAEVEFCFYYSLVRDYEKLDDILCNEFHIGASSENFNTYEQALEAGLQEALKLIES